MKLSKTPKKGKVIWLVCVSCGDDYQTNSFGAFRSRRCKKCSAERATESRKESHKAKLKRIFEEKRALEPRIELGQMTYHVLSSTGQFNKGAAFTTLEMDSMIHMGTILPGTLLSKGRNRYMVKSENSKLTLGFLDQLGVKVGS